MHLEVELGFLQAWGSCMSQAQPEETKGVGAYHNHRLSMLGEPECKGFHSSPGLNKGED